MDRTIGLLVRCPGATGHSPPNFPEEERQRFAGEALDYGEHYLAPEFRVLPVGGWLPFAHFFTSLRGLPVEVVPPW